MKITLSGLKGETRGTHFPSFKGPVVEFFGAEEVDAGTAEADCGGYGEALEGVCAVNEHEDEACYGD